MILRLASAVLAIAILLAFVGDLRVVAPVVAVVLAAAAWRRLVPVVPSLAGVAALLAATVAFARGAEVLAWTLVLAVAAAAGLAVATGTGRSAPARDGVGSTSRAR